MRLQLDSSTLSPAEGGRVTPAALSGTSPGSRAAAVRVSGADSIGLSGASVALSRLAGERTERIQQLTAAVRGGTYQVPSAAIGASILSYGAAYEAETGTPTGAAI